MVSVCYIIVCVSLLSPLYVAEAYRSKYKPTNRKSYQDQIEDQDTYLKSITTKNQDEFLKKYLMPYRNLTYDEELKKKETLCSHMVKTIVYRSKSFKNMMAPKFLPIIPSPVTKAYRNKDEFEIWHGADGNPKTVGCPVGKVSLGMPLSIPPTKIAIIKESHKKVAKVYEDFIRLSPLPACYKYNDSGHWRSITVRSNEAGDVMASVIVKSEGYSIETRDEQQTALKEFFFKHLPNITLYLQECSRPRCSSEKAPFNLLYGKPFIVESLNEYNFTIRPDTIFKLNTLGAEVLYKTIIGAAKLKPNTTFLDMSSTSGIIGILASKYVREVLGIDTNFKKVKDSKYNAMFNDIYNINFLMVRRLFEFNKALKKLNVSSDIVAVMHSPRKLEWDMLRSIRRSPQISRLVYVYLSFKFYKRAFYKTFDTLFLKDIPKFPPFKLEKAIPIDMYPQSGHFELILVFKRSPYIK